MSPARAIATLTLIGLLLVGCGRPATVPRPAEGTRVTVVHVVDGDTVRLSDGRTVRYIGLNTPERGQPFYQEATEANRRLVEGKEAWLVLDVQTTDPFGRTLAYLWVGEQFVNLELLRRGYANAYTAPPNVRYSDLLIAAEAEARKAGIGLWVPANIPLEILKIYYDAPGADADNPNGEWVEIANKGTDVVDMAGFTLKDEGNHLYTFPSVRLAAGQVLKVHSGRGTDSGTTLFWGLAGDAVWDNDGDTAYLRDSQGHLIDSYRY